MHNCYRQPTAYKSKIRERDNYTCQICGAYGDQVDHIIPFEVSHDSNENNVRVLCRPCNMATRRPNKNAALPYEEWAANLQRELKLIRTQAVKLEW